MNYFLWKADSALFSTGSFHLYWYAIILITSYLIAVFWIRKKLELSQGKKAEIWVIICFFISFSFARIGFSLSYSSPDPGGWVSKVLPFYFKSGIQFIGLDKLMLPAGLIGFLVSIWVNKKIFFKHKTYLYSLDHSLPIAVLIAGLFFLGNFLHSDIVGKPTDSGDGTVHMGPIIKGIKELKCCIMRNPDGPNPLKSIEVKKGDSKPGKQTGFKNISIRTVFNTEIEERHATEFIIGDIKTYLFEQAQFVNEPGTEPIKHALVKLPEGNISADITTTGIARYPARFYLFAFCLLLFIMANFIVNRIKHAPGRIAGILILLFSIVYFVLEFITEQPSLMKPIMGFYLSQWYLLPSILFGIICLTFSFTKSKNPA